MSENDIFEKKSTTEAIKDIHDQVPNKLHGILYRMALDIRDLREIVLEPRSQENRDGGLCWADQEELFLDIKNAILDMVEDGHSLEIREDHPSPFAFTLAHKLKENLQE